MALSNDLVSQFAKISKNDSAKTDKSIYGTVVEVNGEKFVKFDGSDLLTPTPVKYTTDISDEDRVIVTVKNHTATVTGNLTAPSAKLDDLIKALNLEGEVAGVKNLIAEKIVASEIAVGDLVADNVTINEKLTANEASIGTLEADNAVINETLVANKAAIGDLEAENATINGVLTANTADIEDLKAKTAEIENLDAKYANIDFANIGEAAIEKMYATTGLIKNLTVENGQIVTGELDVVKINGDLINANTIKADKLVVRGNDGLYYQLNLDSNGKAPVGVSEVDLQNGLHGTKIIADSITADKISVSDLTAFGATIAGFTIVDEEDAPGKLYSGVKESIDNTTAGVYMDSDGQILFGDTTNYVKFFKNEDGTYSLDISASTIKLGGTGKTVEAVIDEKVDSAVGDNVDAAVNDALSDINVGGRNLLLKTRDMSYANADNFAASDASKWYISNANKSYVSISENDDSFAQINWYIEPGWTTNISAHAPVILLPNGWKGRNAVLSLWIYSEDWSSVDDSLQVRFTILDDATSRNGGSLQQYSLILANGSQAANSKVDSVVNGKWTRAYMPFTMDETWFKKSDANLDNRKALAIGFYLLGHGKISIKMPKLEFGTIPTDWSPAPEDSDEAIDNAQADIDNLVIGARNLLRYTNVSSYWDKWGTWPEADTVPTLELAEDYLKVTPAVKSIIITEQPQDITIASNNTVVFSVSASGTNISYQWEFSTNNGIEWATSNGNGNKTNALTFVAQDYHNGYWLRCKITDSLGNVLYSDKAVLYVGTNASTITITKQPSSVFVTIGETATFTVSATGDGLTYQWQWRASSADAWRSTTLAGNTTNTITAPVIATRNGYQYRCIITDSSGNQVTSREVSLKLIEYASSGAYPPKTADLKAGVTYTMSFVAYADIGLNLDYCYIMSDSGNTALHIVIPITAEPKKYSYTFSPTKAYTDCSIMIGNKGVTGTLKPCYIKDLMLEQGTRATDWTPAPEDVMEELTGVQNTADSALHSAEINTSRLNSAELSIDAINATIQSLVTGANGETLMTQTDSGWTFNISSIQNTLSTAVKDIDELDSETSSEIENLKSSVSELGVYTEYIEFGVEKDADGNSQPAIILGEHDSNFKVVITNTDIRFMEGTTVPASISNQSLNIEKAVVTSELKQGGFVWMARENGNYGLVWKGE